MRDAFKIIEPYNLGQETQFFIVFNDLIADMIINKSLHLVSTDLFLGVANYIFL